MTTRARVLVALALGTVAFLAVSRCVDVRSGRNAAIAEMAQRNAQRVSRAYKLSRDSIPALRQAASTAQAAKFAARDNAANLATLADAVSDKSRDVLAGPDSSPARYRAQLVAQVAVTDRLTDAFHAYVAADSASDVANAAHVGSLTRSLDLADSTIAAERATIRALRTVGRCRLGPLPCPSRRTVFVAGVVAGGYLAFRTMR